MGAGAETPKVAVWVLPSRIRPKDHLKDVVKPNDHKH